MRYLVFSVFILVLVSSCTKDEVTLTSKEQICQSDRYISATFTDVKVSTEQYGSNKNTVGVDQKLYMDIYEPTGDTLSKRPAIVLAFGGSFLAGDRKQLSDLAKEFAQLGYVAACIDYRLLSFAQLPIDSVKGLDIAIKASVDMRAAIRYLRKDAATANVYKIDPDFIIAAGLSAGAITAIQAAYFDASDNTDVNIMTAVSKNGGVEGDSGDVENLKYSSKVQAVLNLSGAVYRPQFIDAGEPPIISFHGDKDEVVPYGYDFVKVFGLPIIPLYGSAEIQKRAESIGVSAKLITAVNGGHENIYSDAAYAALYTDFKTQAKVFLKELICQ